MHYAFHSYLQIALKIKHWIARDHYRGRVPADFVVVNSYLQNMLNEKTAVAPSLMLLRQDSGTLSFQSYRDEIR